MNFSDSGSDMYFYEELSDIDNNNMDKECYSASISSSTSSLNSISSIPTSLHWFRLCALRLHDNPGLMAALRNPNTQLRCVVILDKWFIGGKFNVNRLRFLLECLHDLHEQLRGLGLNLYVIQGQTTSALYTLMEEWNVVHLTYQRSHEPHSENEEKTINEMAASKGIKVETFHGHTLYNPLDLLKANGEKPVMNLKDFRALISKVQSPDLPIPAPSLNKDRIEEDDTPAIVLSRYQIPKMESFGYENEELRTNSWIGGEREALERLENYCIVRSKPYEKPTDYLFDKSSLSPYIRFGCLSIRYFWHYVKDRHMNDNSLLQLYQQVISKLLQREFYFLVAYQVPNFDSDENNPVCLPLPWEWDIELFHRWKAGSTGYPWIDAGIRQMLKEGWIHDSVR